jgi:hypothetical protein
MAVVAAALALHSVPGTTLHVGVPPGWRVADRAAPAAVVRAEEKQAGQIAGYIDEAASGKSPLRFVMYDPHRVSGFVTNANVVVQKSPSTSLSKVVTLELTGLMPALDPFDWKQRSARIDGRRAVEVSFKTTVDGPSSKRTELDRQIYFLDKGRFYIVTLTTLPSEAGARNATFDAIVGSLSFAQ